VLNSKGGWGWRKKKKPSASVHHQPRGLNKPAWQPKRDRVQRRTKNPRKKESHCLTRVQATCRVVGIRAYPRKRKGRNCGVKRLRTGSETNSSARDGNGKGETGRANALAVPHPGRGRSDGGATIGEKPTKMCWRKNHQLNKAK